MVGIVIGEVSGHFINSCIQKIYMRRNGGAWRPEVRLWVNYIACPWLIAGLIIFGFGLERRWHYMVVGIRLGRLKPVWKNDFHRVYVYWSLADPAWSSGCHDHRCRPAIWPG